jgi:hypothetical protein
MGRAAQLVAARFFLFVDYAAAIGNRRSETRKEKSKRETLGDRGMQFVRERTAYHGVCHAGPGFFSERIF